MRNFQLPGRSNARSTRTMAATSHPLATLAAVEILRAGGNAFDAAIAASAVQAVVEPQSTGIGGDCFVLFCKDGVEPVFALNGSGRSARAASIAAYQRLALTKMPTYGVHSVTLPGAVEAWFRLSADHGRLPMDQVLAPAIRYAEDGYVVQDRVAFDWAAAAGLLAADPTSAAIFLPGGHAPKAGDVLRQPALGRTLRRLAADGAAPFYTGDLAATMAAHLQSLGGLQEAADFAAVQSDYAQPVATDYRGHCVHQMPPNNQGVTALMILNLLSGYDLAALPPLSAERLHLEVEAARLAYRDRNETLADLPRDSATIRAILSPARTDSLRARIDPARAMTDLPALDLALSDTVYISVVDEDRNAVSFINSTYHSFGSGITCPETGVVFQNRGASFSLDADHPNALAPAKRPMHTIMPGMVTKDGRAVMPYGVMGGDYQPFGHAHVLTNLLDHGMDLQEALDCPRVFYQDEQIVAEHGIPAEAIAGLQSRGHRVTLASEPHGGGQAIWIDWNKGTLTGASDPRKDGLALGY